MRGGVADGSAAESGGEVPPQALAPAPALAVGEGEEEVSVYSLVRHIDYEFTRSCMVLRMSGTMVKVSKCFVFVVWYGVAWCSVVWFGLVWCSVVCYGEVWCGVVWCGVLPFGEVW